MSNTSQRTTVTRSDTHFYRKDRLYPCVWIPSYPPLGVVVGLKPRGPIHKRSWFRLVSLRHLL
ncbi:unnamed protein product [Eretmochelys imbricata]